MTKELLFQCQKREDNFLHALTEGTLMPAEFGDADRTAARIRVDRMKKLRQQRRAKAKNIGKILTPRSKKLKQSTLQPRATVFIDVSLRHRYEQLRSAAARQGKRIVTDVTNADLFVTQVPASPSLSVQWAATLGGGFVMDEKYFVTSGCQNRSVLT